MTRLVLCLIGLAFIGCDGLSLEISQKFAQAESAFESANSPSEFLRAAAIYQEIVDGGIVSGAVLYNQGNAYQKAGERGRAVACYRQALRLRPRDSHVEANLAAALGPNSESKAVDGIAFPFFWQEWFGTTEKLYLMAGLALLTFLMGAAGLVFRGRRWLFSTALVGVVLTIIAGGSAGLDAARWQSRAQGVVVVPDAVARKGSAESYEPAFTRALPEGTEFRAVDRRAGWVLARLADGLEGWIKDSDVVLY